MYKCSPKKNSATECLIQLIPREQPGPKGREEDSATQFIFKNFCELNWEPRPHRDTANGVGEIKAKNGQ